MRTVDNLHSDAHNAAGKTDETQRMWLIQSDKTLELKFLKTMSQNLLKI